MTREMKTIQLKIKDCSECPFNNLIQKQVPQLFDRIDRVYNIFCQKQNNALVGEMVNGVCRTGIPGSCPFLVEGKQEFKEPKFDPKTLRPFDKIIVRDNSVESWSAALFSHINYNLSEYDFEGSDDIGFIIVTTGSSDFSYCIPFNDETKHLVGTSDEAPEFCRYWEETHDNK